jgi:hypothetical protein
LARRAGNISWSLHIGYDDGNFQKAPMIEEIRQIIAKIQSLPPDQRSGVIATSIFISLAKMTYYIMLGIVVIILGRRLIYATLSAWKEARREPS